jgi:coenzyme F420 hydrogenase subunit beta
MTIHVTEMQRMDKGLKELREEVLETDSCTACGTCVDLCPQIISIEDRIGVLGECRLTSGRCYWYCPRTDPDPRIADALFGDAGYGGGIGPYHEYCMSRNTLYLKDAPFQYGGVVSALMIQGIEEGLVDRAVVTRAVSNRPVPITVWGRRGIIDAAGSKFALAPTNKEVNRSGMDAGSRIGAVALPCQALGLRKKQLLPRDDGIAEGRIELIIGLFCTWALSQEGWLSLIARHVGDADIRRIDIPPPPANRVEIIAGGHKHVVSLDEVKPFVRPGCKVCLDMTAENADISVGMVEGRGEYDTVIVRTEVGKRLLHHAVASGRIEIAALDEERWSHLSEASIDKKKRAVVEAEKRTEPVPYYRRIVSLRNRIWL